MVPAEDSLLPPPGAKVTDRADVQNCYGKFSYIMASLPEATDQRSKSDLG